MLKELRIDPVGLEDRRRLRLRGWMAMLALDENPFPNSGDRERSRVGPLSSISGVISVVCTMEWPFFSDCMSA
jgi:hypothetical protein